MASYLVTGASRGLGYEFVRQLSQNKSNTVIGIVRNRTTTDERLAKDGITNVTIFQADITDIPALQKAAVEANQVLPNGLDYLIPNAAVMGDQSALVGLSYFEDKPEALNEELIVTFTTNVLGVANVVSAFLPLIKKGKAKKVISISTGMADNDLVNDFKAYMGGPYAVSKAALNSLVAKYNADYAKQGILFMAVSPGFVDTSEGKSPDLPPELMKGLNDMLASFKQYKPDFSGPITPEESVNHVLQLAERATVAEFGGRFVSHFGNKQWL